MEDVVEDGEDVDDDEDVVTLVEVELVSVSSTWAGVGVGVGVGVGEGVGVGVVVVVVGDATLLSFFALELSELEVSSGVAAAVTYPPTGPSNVLAAVW